jgi:hypothetical protein
MAAPHCVRPLLVTSTRWQEGAVRIKKHSNFRGIRACLSPILWAGYQLSTTAVREDRRPRNLYCYPIWWPGGPFICRRLPPPEFRRAPLKNQRLGRAPLNN